MTTTLTTTWFQDNYGTIDWSVPVEIGAAFYTRSPALNRDSADVFAGMGALDDLLARPEWVPTTTTAPSTREGVPTSLYAQAFHSGLISGLQIVDASGVSADLDSPDAVYGWTFPNQERVAAVVFYLVDSLGGLYGGGINPIMFATTQGIGTETIVHDGAAFGQFQDFDITHGAVHFLTVDATPSFQAAYLLLKPALPDWEGAHTQHMWLEPQRVNLLANPSFEGGVNNWRWEGPPNPELLIAEDFAKSDGAGINHLLTWTTTVFGTTPVPSTSGGAAYAGGTITSGFTGGFRGLTDLGPLAAGWDVWIEVVINANNTPDPVLNWPETRLTLLAFSDGGSGYSQIDAEFDILENGPGIGPWETSSGIYFDWPTGYNLASRNLQPGDLVRAEFHHTGISKLFINGTPYVVGHLTIGGSGLGTHVGFQMSVANHAPPSSPDCYRLESFQAGTIF